LELEESDRFRDDLRPWRSCEVSDSIPPLVVETYLDLRSLNEQQPLVLVDSIGKAWNAPSKRSEVVLERWVIEFVPPEAIDDELPVVYKKAIVVFRSLYTYVHVMPSWILRRKLAKAKLTVSPISIGCRIVNGGHPISSRGRIGLTKKIIESEDPHLENFHFTGVGTPAGALKISVSYRKMTDFRVGDSETLLSTHFLNLDKNNDEPTPAYKESTGSVSSPVQTRPSVSFIQPFKSPSMSASPDSATVASSSPRKSSFSRISSNSSLAALRIPKRNPSVSSAVGPISSSITSSTSSAPRYSSSFGSRGQWPRSGSAGSRRPQSFIEPSSVGSTASSTGEPGSGLYLPNNDLGDFVKMVDSAHRSFTSFGVDSDEDRPNPLARFQLLKGNHSALSDSLQSSVYLPKDELTSSSPAGRGLSHTPVVPSRLSEEFTAEDVPSRRRIARNRASRGSIDEDLPTNASSSPLDIPSNARIRGRRESLSLSNRRTLGYDDMHQPVDLESHHQSLSRDDKSMAQPKEGQDKPDPPYKVVSRRSTGGPGTSYDDDDLLFAMSDMHLARGEEEYGPRQY
jgi:autophagy-related protein 13